VVPALLVGEAGYMLERDLGARGLDAFLAAIVTGRFTLHCGEDDVPRVRELAARYADLPLGVADAAVAVCAERHGGRVLTLDRRDFDVVAGEARLEVLP
jgi:predicted nucleic acid-binding protein